ncbi:hypothetical protein GCK72_018223 [Caenorhabditis remanei]|uniref:Uncharacterized protein n=1 Tax=Caenorhabditis remanei TaxID=31234 RepID=A0A6A5GB84_CAERE|nr:hypothetical protein GCK72_018223 [Caenorhabditis remanei]KAF1751669.1 hypothetical protein GCK72_018223 [Caenorhabditis remanei]
MQKLWVGEKGSRTFDESEYPQTRIPISKLKRNVDLPSSGSGIQQFFFESNGRAEAAAFASLDIPKNGNPGSFSNASGLPDISRWI